jgi:mannose-6-phosphate isomerase-like protein (cupin superfamily)
MAGRVLAALRPLRQAGPAAADPAEVAVCGHLMATLNLAAKEPTAAIAEALAPCRRDLNWRQNPNYGREPSFAANYGYTELIGPDGLIRSETLRLGFLLLGPGTLSAPHHHPAEELYVPIGGRALWWMEGSTWQKHAPGSLVYHRAWRPHAMRTEDEPLLALFAWLGDLAVASRLTAT